MEGAKGTIGYEGVCTASKLAGSWLTLTRPRDSSTPWSSRLFHCRWLATLSSLTWVCIDMLDHIIWSNPLHCFVQVYHHATKPMKLLSEEISHPCKQESNKPKPRTAQQSCTNTFGSLDKGTDLLQILSAVGLHSRADIQPNNLRPCAAQLADDIDDIVRVQATCQNHS